MKRKALRILLAGGLALALSFAIAACGNSSAQADVGGAAGGKILTLASGIPDGSLGVEGDLCLVIGSKTLYRKTASGWAETEYSDLTSEGNTFTVSYPDGSTEAYDVVSETDGLPCKHENLSEVYPVYSSLCVVPGIGVRYCLQCNMAFPVVIPSPGSHAPADDGYTCTLCGEFHILDADGMKKFADAANAGTDFSGKTVYLDDDLDVGEVEGWTPISKFNGIFNGQGHTILNSAAAQKPENKNVFDENVAPSQIEDLNVELAVEGDGFVFRTQYGEADEEVNTYVIKTADGLRAFRDMVNGGKNTFAGQTVELANDIDLNYQLFFRIGISSSGKRFAGTFNGNGFEIKNVKVASSASEDTAQTMEIGEVFNTLANGGTASVTTAADNCLSKDAVLNYTVHNYGDLEQIYTWKDYKNGSATKENNYSIGGERTWIVNNAAGMKLFRDRVNNLYQNYGNGTTKWQYCSYAYDTVKLATDIDLKNEPFVLVKTTFTGKFDSQGYQFTNVVTGSVSTNAATSGQTLKSQAFGQVFADYTSGTAAIDYKVYNAGDFEQVSVYSKKSGEAMHADHQWYIHNADGMRLFSAITNTQPAWYAADRGDAPINFAFAPTPLNGETRMSHTIHLAAEIDLENELVQMIPTSFAGTFRSDGHGFTNVVSGLLNTATGKVEKSQEYGQIFVDYNFTNKTSATAEFDITIHNEGDFEQISHYSKAAGEMTHAEHQWYVNNTEGFKKFASIVKSTHAWKSSVEPQYPIQFTFAPTLLNGEPRLRHTIDLKSNIDLKNEPFILISSFAGVFNSNDHIFTNVVTGNVLNGETIRSQEYGQIFADYSKTGNATVFDYTVHNEGDFEQVSVYTKKAGEVMYADHQWYVNNVDGLKKFASIVNSAYAWNKTERGDGPIQFTFAPTLLNGEPRMTHTIHMMDDIDLKNELFVTVNSRFAGTFLSEGHTFYNVVTGSVSTNAATLGQTLKYLAYGQVFSDYSGGTAEFDYKIVNKGDFEQVSVYSKKSGEAMHAEYDWYIHNADGLRLFSDITNSHPAWNAADRGDVPITFNFTPTITNGDTRINHTVHLTCDIDLENVPFVRVASGFAGIFDSGNYVIKNVCPAYSATDLRQAQEWGQVFVNNTQTNSDIHYTVHNGTDFEQVSTFSKERGEKLMYAKHDWYIRNEAGFAQFAAILGSAYDWKAENRGDNPIYFGFTMTLTAVNGENVLTDSNTVHLMKDLTVDNFEYPNHYLNTSNADAYRYFYGLFDGGNHTITTKALARTGVEMGRLVPAKYLANTGKLQDDGTYPFSAKIINLKMAYADSTVLTAFGGYTATYNEMGEYSKPAWQIDSVERLTAFRDLVRSGRDFLNENVILMTDLDLKDAAWAPIGTETNSFRGTFDGNHKTISRFRISGGSYLGFFSRIADATTVVKDLTLSAFEVNGTGDHIGGLAGYSSATVTNVVIDGATVKSSYSGDAYVGGFVGYGYGGTITGSTIKESNVSGGNYLGGISGQGYTKIKGCTVENCTITALSWKAGGIIGQLGEGNFSSEAASFDDDVVKGTTLIVSDGLMGYSWGALVGFCNYGDKTFNRCKVIDCTIRKTTSGDLSGVGGFIGEYYASDDLAVFNDCEIDGLNLETNDSGINGVGGFIGCGYWRGYTGLTVTFNNCSVRIGTVTTAEGAAIKSFGAFIGDAAANTVVFGENNFYSGCDTPIGSCTGTVTGSPTKKD